MPPEKMAKWVIAAHRPSQLKKKKEEDATNNAAHSFNAHMDMDVREWIDCFNNNTCEAMPEIHKIQKQNKKTN